MFSGAITAFSIFIDNCMLVAYHFNVKQRLPGAVSLPFTSYSDEIDGKLETSGDFFCPYGIG